MPSKGRSSPPKSEDNKKTQLIMVLYVWKATVTLEESHEGIYLNRDQCSGKKAMGDFFALQQTHDILEALLEEGHLEEEGAITARESLQLLEELTGMIAECLEEHVQVDRKWN